MYSDENFDFRAWRASYTGLALESFTILAIDLV
jgi:hypothetical protein